MTDHDFTPIKSAQRSLAGAKGFWVSPEALNLERVEESELLSDIGVKPDWSLAGAGGLPCEPAL